MVIVTYNHARDVQTCLAAVQATVPPGTELLVVDNASADGTPDVVRRSFPGVQVVESGANLGYGGANNLGATRATGDVLVFLNPDTAPRPGWLEALLDALAQAAGPALATPMLLLARDPLRVDTLGNDVHVSGITPSRRWGAPAASARGTEEVAAVSGACFAIPRSLFWKLGGFDDRYFLYYEDTDLSLRARLVGARCLAVANAQVLHDHSPGFPPAKLRYLERNRYWTLLKLLDWRTFAALLPALALGELLAWALAWREGKAHLRAKAQAWCDVLGWLPDLPASRRQARRYRRLSDRALLEQHSTRLPFAQALAGSLARRSEALMALAFALARAWAKGVLDATDRFAGH